MIKCPKCGSEKVFEGRHFNVFSGGAPQYFRPKGLKLITLSDADVTILDSAFKACADCGLLWSAVDPNKLRKVVEESGREKLRKKLKK